MRGSTQNYGESGKKTTNPPLPWYHFHVENLPAWSLEGIEFTSVFTDTSIVIWDPLRSMQPLTAVASTILRIQPCEGYYGGYASATVL